MVSSICTTKLGVAALALFTGVALCLLALAFDAPPADAATINVPCTTNQLIAAIETANSNGPNPDTIELAPDCTYALSSPYVEPGASGELRLLVRAFRAAGDRLGYHGGGERRDDRAQFGSGHPLPAAVCRCRPVRPRHLWVRDPGGWQPDASGSNASGRGGQRWRCDRRWGRRRWHGRRYIQPGRGHAGAGDDHELHRARRQRGQRVRGRTRRWHRKRRRVHRQF